MIDIVFNLIIFFVVGTRFVGGGEQAAGPGSGGFRGREAVAGAGETRRQCLPRRTNLAGRQIPHQPFNSGRNWRRLERGAAGLSVIVRGDGEGTFQNVAAVLNACRQAGISDMGISVRLPAKGG